MFLESLRDNDDVFVTVDVIGPDRRVHPAQISGKVKLNDTAAQIVYVEYKAIMQPVLQGFRYDSKLVRLHA